ncbi:MAG: hypothetical protein ACREC2_06615, partial [Bradyrhizobium sp.]
KIHQHEQKQEKRDSPGALRRRLCGHGRLPVFCLLALWGPGPMLGTGLPALQLDFLARPSEETMPRRRVMRRIPE